MRNNDLKYLSRRKILIEERMKGHEQEGREGREDGLEEKIIEGELAKLKKSEKLFQFFSRAREIHIDGQETVLKVTRGSTSIMIELSKASDKENNEGDL
jgi:hypothetical protein